MEKKIFWIVAAIFVLLGLGYFVFPADFINDLIPLIGMIDDLVINLITLCGAVGSIVGAIYLMKRPTEAPAYDTYESYGDYYEQ